MTPIGGYFELGINPPGDHYHSDCMKLNSASNAFELLLDKRRVRRVHLPSYICESMLNPLRRQGVEFRFYNIDGNFEPSESTSLDDGERFLYVNYFGLKDDFIQSFGETFRSRLVIDNSQAFFSAPMPDVDTLYSPRKFLGVSDGGYLFARGISASSLPVSKSHGRIRHLVGRMEACAGDFYPDYQLSEQQLEEEPVSRMSKFTDAILRSIDYRAAIQRRSENFVVLNNRIGSLNKLDFHLTSLRGRAPMIYPMLVENPEIRLRLIQQGIFVARYWDDVLHRKQSSEWERYLAEHLVPLPIDQRYGPEEMNYIADIMVKMLGD